MTDYYVLHSGGLDSTSALAVCQKMPDARNVAAIAVNYGQRHIAELAAAAQIIKKLGVKQYTLDLTGFGNSVTSALTTPDIEVPDGTYNPDNMAATVVPGRNAVFLSAAAGLASSKTTDGEEIVIVTATHGGDHELYPDCRPEFIAAMNKALRLGSGAGVWAPFSDKTKAEIVEIGTDAGAPLELTWSCYKGGTRHCGTCGTCTERREAFITAGITDPTSYTP